MFVLFFFYFPSFFVETKPFTIDVKSDYTMALGSLEIREFITYYVKKIYYIP